MNKLKIVIISGVIYPRISPRSFRATELAKALAKKGHDVKLVAQLGEYNYASFQEKHNIEVENIGVSNYARITSDGKIKLPLWRNIIIYLLKRLLEFPDILLMKKVKRYLEKEKDIDLLITVAIPYPIHWGGALVSKDKRNFKIWVSDCGDPYMYNAVHKPPFYFKYLEDKWGRMTDYVTVPVEAARYSYSPKILNKIKVIPQGFDFSEIKPQNYSKNETITFIYAGAFYPLQRDPTEFLNYLSKLNRNFKFVVYTGNASLLSRFQNTLNGKLEVYSPIDREVLMGKMSKADFLINIENSGTKAQVPSKLIDYALTGRPILEISSDFGEEERQQFNEFMDCNYRNQKTILNLDDYNIENVAEKFLELYKL